MDNKIQMRPSTLPSEGISKLKNPSLPQSNKKEMDLINHELNKEYTKLMIEEMQKTIPKESETSQEVGFYLSLLNDEYAQMINDQRIKAPKSPPLPTQYKKP
jgi:hypothetical protein